jgi:DsbC/DsbD-like thiol-disulfide interchange protein
MRTDYVGMRIVAGLVAGALVLAAGMLTDLRAGAKKADDKVKVTASATKPDAAGKQIVTVTFVIDKGWHIYANPVGNELLAEAKTVVDIKSTGKPEVKVKYPDGKVFQDKDDRYRIYENKVSIQATVLRAKGDASPLEVSVRYNACDDKQCLPPAKRTFKLK